MKKKRKKDKRIFWIILIVVFILVIFFISGNFTGKAVKKSITSCKDTDNGDFPNVKGMVTHVYLESSGIREKDFSKEFNDYCSYGNTLIEYYCSDTGRVGSILYYCKDECKDGTCVPK